MKHRLLIKTFIYQSILLTFLLCNCCKKAEEQIEKPGINPNIELLINSTPGGLVNIPSAIWPSSDTIYTAAPFGICLLNQNLKPLSYSIYAYTNTLYIEASPLKHKLLLIKSIYLDQTYGGLYEYDLDSSRYTKLVDSSYNISSAKYYRDEQHIIYYSYGNPLGINAGYYILDKTKNQTQLLFSFFRDAGPVEFVNGFDIHPTKTVLLIPIVYHDSLPRIIEYNFFSQMVDTIKVRFDSSALRTNLWLRYNLSGDKILYCNFPRHAMDPAPYNDSEVGIINRADLKKRVLDVKTNKYQSIAICPHWSPDEKNIIFCSAPISDMGSRGLYAVYLLKNIDSGNKMK